MTHRPNLLHVALLGCAALFSAATLPAQTPDLTGYWDLRIPNPNGDGTFRETFFHIEQSGDTISGEVVRRPKGTPITGTLTQGTLHFVTVPSASPAASSRSRAAPPAAARHL